MTMFTKKETRQSSLMNQKIRKASFVPTDEFSEKFKYNLSLSLSKYISNKFIVMKTILNKIIQVPQLWLQKIDFAAIRNVTAMWLIEAFIEGFVINFIVWKLLKWEMTLLTILAWGFAVKQLLSMNERLRKNGTITTIPKKHE